MRAKFQHSNKLRAVIFSAFVVLLFLPSVALPQENNSFRTTTDLNLDLDCEAFEPVLQGWELSGDELTEASRWLNQCYFDRARAKNQSGDSWPRSPEFYTDARKSIAALDVSACQSLSNTEHLKSWEKLVCGSWVWEPTPYRSPIGYHVPQCFYHIRFAYDRWRFSGMRDTPIRIQENCLGSVQLYNSLDEAERKRPKVIGLESLKSMNTQLSDIDEKTREFFQTRCDKDYQTASVCGFKIEP